MESGRPSRTALGAASHRAAHQVLERGAIFTDPLALPILGEHAGPALERAEREPDRRGMRLFIAVRTRFAEDALAAACARGVSQLVVLGAGLDTFAYRSPYGARLRVFEVDHPATQAWKRERLMAAGIAVPETLAFAPVDFEREALSDGLVRAGFDATRPAFFTWLGVVPYLTTTAVSATLRWIGTLAAGTEVAFDYANPPADDDPAELKRLRDALAERVAALGESLQAAYETEVLHAELRSLGFHTIEDLAPHAIAARYFPGVTRTGPDRGGHIVRAAN